MDHSFISRFENRHLDQLINCSYNRRHHFSFLSLRMFIHLCICNGNFHLHPRLDADGRDLLDDLRRTVQINQTLVDPHLKAIPGFGSFAAGGLPGGDAQSLHKFKTADFSQRQSKTPTYKIHKCLGIHAAISFPTGGVLKTDLCWHADRSLHLQVLLFGPSDQVSTDCGRKAKIYTHTLLQLSSTPLRSWCSE